MVVRGTRLVRFQCNSHFVQRSVLAKTLKSQPGDSGCHLLWFRNLGSFIQAMFVAPVLSAIWTNNWLGIMFD